MRNFTALIHTLELKIQELRQQYAMAQSAYLLAKKEFLDHKKAVKVTKMMCELQRSPIATLRIKTAIEAITAHEGEAHYKAIHKFFIEKGIEPTITPFAIYHFLKRYSKKEMAKIRFIGNGEFVLGGR